MVSHHRRRALREGLGRLQLPDQGEGPRGASNPPHWADSGSCSYLPALGVPGAHVSLSKGGREQTPLWNASLSAPHILSRHLFSVSLHGVCFLVSMMRVTAPHHGAASAPRSSHPRAHPPTSVWRLDWRVPGSRQP